MQAGTWIAAGQVNYTWCYFSYCKRGLCIDIPVVNITGTGQLACDDLRSFCERPGREGNRSSVKGLMNLTCAWSRQGSCECEG